MRPTPEKKYITHNSGIWGLYQFLDTYLKFGYRFDINARSVIELSSFFSQHIGFGSVNNKKLGKNLFLLFSQQCYDYLKLISWEKIIIDEFTQRIYLVSSFVAGDKEQWPDIAPFALSFYYENPQKIINLKNVRQLDIKPYSFLLDETSGVEEFLINHKNSFNLPVVFRLNDNEPIINTESLEVENYFDIMTKQINDNISKYNNYVPDFQGDFIETADHAALKKNGVYDGRKK